MKSALKFSLLVALFLTACDQDFLDRKPKGLLTYDTFFKTEEHALQATNAVYNKFRTWEFTGLPFLGATDILSDDADKGSTPNDALYLLEIDDFTANTANEVYGAMWRGHYQAIFRANIAIENIPQIEMDEDYKNRLIGESKFLRAFCYLRLVQWYGEIPIIKTQLQESEYFTQARKPLAEIYSFIEKDLMDAIATLPEKSAYKGQDLGRVTKGAARGILAKLYMLEEKYAKALEQCNFVINSNEYSLLPSYSEIFTEKGEQGRESIFEISAVALQSSVAGSGASSYNMVQGVRGSPNLGWGFNRPSDDLVKSYEPGDPRRQATIIYVGEILPDGATKVEDNPDMFEERYNQKAWVPSHPGLQDNGPGNIRLLRYADILLLAAEASNEINDTPLALNYLNQIRKRARGTNNFILADITTTDKNLLREKIRKERRVELAMEQQRWFDLLRWKNVSESMIKQGKKFISNKHELLPIPQAEIDLSAGSLKQNNGW
jgi:starch-binding outer membrane protein, SusD/RagB family